MPSAGRILLVDDEVDLVEALRFSLEREGYELLVAGTASKALSIVRRGEVPDLVLLDLMLPDFSGVEVCRALRDHPATQRTPILMLTARGGEEDRVNGFEAGADDYVAKPFSVRELVLRVRALLRRSDGPPSESGEAKGSAMTRGPIEIDVASHRVLVDGADLSLTALEFRLLHTLMDRAGKVQSREVLLKDVWGMNPELTTRTVDTHVTRLRRKLGAQPGQWIETLRGVGYRFRTEDPSGRG